MVRAKVRFEDWAPDTYQQRVRSLLEAYSPQVGDQFQAEISRSQFGWPNDTQRKSGEFVPKGPRNIVDLGNFRNSQTPGVLVAYNLLTFEWTAAYALAIFLGYYDNAFQKQKVRDWVTPALEKESLLAFFAANWTQRKP